MTDDSGAGPDSIMVPGDDGSTLIAADLNRAVPGFDTLVARYADGSSRPFEDLGSGSTLVGINGARLRPGLPRRREQGVGRRPGHGRPPLRGGSRDGAHPPLPEADVAAPEVPVWAQGIGDGSSVAVDNSSSISFPSPGEMTMPPTLDSSISYPNQGETTTQFEIRSSLSPGILDSPSFEMDLSTMPAAPESTDIAPTADRCRAPVRPDPGTGSPFDSGTRSACATSRPTRARETLTGSSEPVR